MKKKLPMGAFEDAVMEVLWADGGWMTPSEIHSELAQGRTLAYTTVTTTLVRLVEKGRLERHPDGRAFVYHPTLTRAQWVAARMSEVLAGGGDRTTVLGHFVETLDERQRTQLRRMLAARGEQ